MTKLPEFKTTKVIKALDLLGFQEVRHKGGYAIYRHADGRWTTVPIHPSKSIDPDLLADILKQIKVTPEEFLYAIRRGK
jgi:predicted RNA binding protein YcfA (HicA-like mRNA interferase family)